MRILICCVFVFTIRVGMSQSTDFPIGHTAYQLIELEDIRSSTNFYTAVKPYDRQSSYEFLQRNLDGYFSKEMRLYSNDSSESSRPLFKNIYRYPADMFFYQDNELELHVNPVFQLSLGQSNEENVETLFIYSRGLEIRGNLDKRVGFYTVLTENQARYPEYVRQVTDSTLAVPFEGFWKQVNDTGVDFLRAQGHIDFGLSKSISAQLGYGKHFVGDGVRSLILSDYSNNYPYLRINTKTKPFEYTNIFAELISDLRGNVGGIFGTGGFTKKYLAMHHLSINLRPNLTVGLFESVMYGDSTGSLKLEYLNPIIFYRAVEQQNGSEDNALVGMDFKWNIKNRVSLYGQLAIDELIVKEALSGDGWWGNKQAFQLGAKYVDAFGTKNLMLQGEINKVRPYMYGHKDGFTSYSHYDLALAHPLGANFTEYLGRATYRLSERWNFEGMLMIASYGNDVGDQNFGRDILKSNNVRRQNAIGQNIDFGNAHLQGNKTDLSFALLRTTYMWKHNLFFDLEATIRNEKDTNGQIDTSSTIFGFSCRWNVPIRRYLF